jgi:hypothetical protein
MSGNWFAVFDEVREASLEFAASAAEVYAGTVGRCDCGMSGCKACRAHRTARSDCRTGGDFLADLIRLQVSYLSQLARMSSSYSGLVTRAVGSLYDAVAPSPPPPSAAPKSEVLLVGGPGHTASATFSVRNSLPDDEELVVEQGDGDHVEVELKAVGNGHSHKVRARLSREPDGKPLAGIELEPGECVRGVLSVVLPREEGRYTGTVRLTIGECTRRLRLRVHVRP